MRCLPVVIKDDDDDILCMSYCLSPPGRPIAYSFYCDIFYIICWQCMLPYDTALSTVIKQTAIARSQVGRVSRETREINTEPMRMFER